MANTNLEFGPYRLVINANNAEKGVIPLVNVLRDPRWSFTHGCTEYKQVWTGDLVGLFDMIENATRPRYCRDELANTFNDRIAPGFVGFSAGDMQAMKNAFIENTMDNYKEWYACHLDALAELIHEYDAGYLRAIYSEEIDNGNDPKDAFLSVICTALERDL